MSGVGRTTSNASSTAEPAVAIVVIVLSAGGLAPLRRLIQDLDGELPAAIVIAQHVRESTLLPEILSSHTTMAVSYATSGEVLLANHIYVCPGGKHMIVNPDATLTVSDRGRVGYFRPSGDWLLESAGASFAERTFAIVLSGLQSDGSRGVKRVRKGEGTVIAQEPSTCRYPAMPLAALATGCVDHVLAPDAIGPFLNAELANISIPACAARRDDPFADAAP